MCSKCLFVTIYLFACSSAFSLPAPPLPDPDTGLIGVQCFSSRSIYFSLCAKASIYECTVKKCNVLPRGNTGVERGSVILSVQRTFFGEERKTITLPCQFLDEKRANFVDDDAPIWPDLNHMPPEARLCIIVVPKCYDRLAPVISGVDQAASFVFVADRSADGGFEWLQRILNLQSLLKDVDRPKAIQALNSAVNHPDTRVRDYSIDALADQCAELCSQDRLFGMLREGDDVIVASIANVAPIADNSKSSNEGLVTLDVNSWLHGTGNSRMTISYVCEKTGVPLRARLPYVWPPVDLLKKGSMLLCFLKPVKENERAENSDRAKLVWPISGKDDPIIATTKNLIALESINLATDWTQQLTKDLSASEPLIRQYCVDAVAHDIGQKNADEAVSMLGEHLTKLTKLDAGPIEAFSTVQRLETLASSKDPAIVVKVARAFVLGASAIDNSETVRRYSLQALAIVVQRPGAPAAATVLDKGETTGLLNSLEHSVTPTDEWATERVTVLKWCSK